RQSSTASCDGGYVVVCKKAGASGLPLLVNNDRISDGGPSRRTCLRSRVIVCVTDYISYHRKESLFLPDHDRLSHHLVNIHLKGFIHVRDGIHLNLGADDITQISENLRMFLIHFHGLYKIFPAASAASKQAKTFFQHHTGVDRDRVFGHTEKRD